MPREFFYSPPPMRVSFGVGERWRLVDELNHFNLKKILILATNSHGELARQLSDSLGDRCAGIYSKIQMHVPLETAHQARAYAAEIGADGFVTLGGGSTTGLGKAIALESGMPIVALPTTYAGSEMTDTWGITTDGVKKTGQDSRVLPVSVIYDPELTLSLPVNESVTSGFNAIAHAVEALYAPDGSPIVSLMAEEGARALCTALPGIVEQPRSIDSRNEALYGAWLCGATLGATTMSLHHKLCHTLGGTFDLPHAETHTVMLPYTLAYNAGSVPAAIEALKRATGSEDPAAYLRELSMKLGAPTSLRELGLSEEDLTIAADLSTRNPYANPREIRREDAYELLICALNGGAYPNHDEVSLV